MPASLRVAAALAFSTLLTAGCDTVRDVTQTADSAANTAQICAEAAPKVATALQQAATAVANYRPGTAAEVEADLERVFSDLQSDLAPLAAKAQDADVKAALEQVDATANRWASNPDAFVQDGVSRFGELNDGLMKACGVG